MMVTPLERRGSLEAAELEKLLRQPPRQVDCSALKAELDAVEQRGGSERLLKQGRSKYKYAERAQRTARTKELVSQVRELMEVTLARVLTLALALALALTLALFLTLTLTLSLTLTRCGGAACSSQTCRHSAPLTHSTRSWSGAPPRCSRYRSLLGACCSICTTCRFVPS